MFSGEESHVLNVRRHMTDYAFILEPWQAAGEWYMNGCKGKCPPVSVEWRKERARRSIAEIRSRPRPVLP